MIIDNTYFKNQIYIPHAKPTLSSSVIGVSEDMVYFIEEYTKDCLIKCLGFQLFEELRDNIDESQETKVNQGADAKWGDLINGKVYTNSDGLLVKWNGIRFKTLNTAESLYDSSFLANYVYFFYEKSTSTTRTNTGHQIENAKNATIILSPPKVFAAWRKFVDMVQGENIRPNIIRNNYGEWLGLDYFAGGKEITLYQFIEDSNNLVPGTYANFTPKFWHNINQFGI